VPGIGRNRSREQNLIGRRDKRPLFASAPGSGQSTEQIVQPSTDARLPTWQEDKLVPDSEFTGGALLARDARGQGRRLSLRKYHLDVYIEDGFARTTLDLTHFNDDPFQREGTFLFPLPADASLSRLAMYVDGKRMEGGMAERDYARGVFDSIVSRRRDPALLEWVDGNTFRMRVFPLEPRQEKRIILGYAQRLPSVFDRMQYRFPIGHSLERAHSWSWHALVKGGTALGWKSNCRNLAEIKAGSDLVLDAATKETELGGELVLELAPHQPPPANQTMARFYSAELDGEKYFMVRYRPVLPATTTQRPRDWIFLIETSADRDRLVAQAQVEVVHRLLARAGQDDRFALFAANAHVHAFASELRPAKTDQVQAAIRFLQQAHVIGALNLRQALEACRSFVSAGRESFLVHIGSGFATLGESDTESLVRRIPQGLEYVGIGVGRRWAQGFMTMAAARTGGHGYRSIPPNQSMPPRQFERLRRKLSAAEVLESIIIRMPPQQLYWTAIGSDEGPKRYLTALDVYGSSASARAWLAAPNSDSLSPVSMIVGFGNLASSTNSGGVTSSPPEVSYVSLRRLVPGSGGGLGLAGLPDGISGIAGIGGGGGFGAGLGFGGGGWTLGMGRPQAIGGFSLGGLGLGALGVGGLGLGGLPQSSLNPAGGSGQFDGPQMFGVPSIGAGFPDPGTQDLGSQFARILTSLPPPQALTDPFADHPANNDGQLIRLEWFPCQAPDLKPDLRDLVVLPLPLRSGQDLANCELENMPAALSAALGEREDSGMLAIFFKHFYELKDKRLGIYTLLVSTLPDFDRLQLVGEQPQTTLAQYLALIGHYSPGANKIALTGPQDGFVQRLGALYQLRADWQGGRMTEAPLQRTQDQGRRLLDYLSQEVHPFFALGDPRRTAPGLPQSRRGELEGNLGRQEQAAGKTQGDRRNQAAGPEDVFGAFREPACAGLLRAL
jgi:hypothetical protein